MTLHPLYRKIGGLHWFRFGRLRIAICWSRRRSIPAQVIPFNRKAA